jgi:CubicO group peptidase (beta-lactamase class C family)
MPLHIPAQNGITRRFSDPYNPGMSEPVDKYSAAVDVIERGIAEGVHPGAQLCIRQHGQEIANLAFGQARFGVPMRSDTLLLWMSNTKPIVAVAIAQLVERGLLGFDDPVVKYLPAFAAKGKSAITIAHILTHTADLRNVLIDTTNPWDAQIDLICNSRMETDWIPGEKAGYCPMATWFILGEIMRIVSGEPVDVYLRKHIFEPMHLADAWLSISPEVYAEYGDRIGVMHITQPPPAKASDLDTPQAAARVLPASGGRGPASALAALYQMLLDDGRCGDQQILSPKMVHTLRHRQRAGMFDHTFKQQIDLGYGLILARPDQSNFNYGYGRFASAQTFGHGGSLSSSAFADPAHNLVVALIFNGMPGAAAHHIRMRLTIEAIYTDLGLAE